MKHNKLSISIVSAFIAALGLTACSNAAVAEDDLVTIKGYDGTELHIKRDDIYGKLVESEDGVTSFYNAILEVLIRNHFENDAQSAKLKSFEQTAHDKVAADHKKAKSDSKTNNTSYDDEWQAILDANGVKDEEGLYQKHLYSLEKEDFADSYFDENKSSLTSEYIGFKNDGTEFNEPEKNNTSVYPYHVRHILVSTEGSSATDYVSGLITEKQANNLNTVYQMLNKGENTFGEIAYQRSDDKGSKVKYGDSGIMSTKTSFVNEFKLGLYAYDVMFEPDVTGVAAKKASGTQAYDKLGFNSEYNGQTVGEALTGKKVQKVGYNVFEYLGEVADVTTDDKGNKVNEGVEKYFPRNVVWNECLNLHNPFVIVDTPNPELPVGTAPKALTKDTKTGFRTIKAFSDTERVLTDEDGRIIVGVRSEFGIHFMVMERTPFEIEKGISAYDSANKAYTYDTTTINDYYTTSIPKAGDTKDTYVSHLNGSKTDYAARASEVKNEIKGFDTMYDYRLFEQLMNNDTIKINDPAVEKEISKLIDNKRDNIEWTTSKDIQTAWGTYLDKLAKQQEDRTSGRLLKLTCATNFEKAYENDAFTLEGGDCYYEA